MNSTSEDHQTDQIDSTPVESAIVRAARPMSEAQMAAFLPKMNRGWNPVARHEETEVAPVQPESQAPKSTTVRPTDPLTDEIYRWLVATRDEHISKSPRQCADAALPDFLVPPCTTEELLAFFSAFASAYQRVIRQEAETMGRTSTAATVSNEDSLITSSPERTAERIERLEALAVKNSLGASFYRLSQFAGCSAAELSLYFTVPESDVQKQLENRHYDICHSSSEI